MKKLIFTSAMLLASLTSFSQEPYKVFCELLGHQKFMSSKNLVTVDFGQKVSFWEGGSKQYLVQSDGSKLEFNSMVDAMNFMGKLGWEFEQAYVVTVGQQNVYHWLLSKKVTNDDQIIEGFMTKKQYDELNKDKED